MKCNLTCVIIIVLKMEEYMKRYILFGLLAILGFLFYGCGQETTQTTSYTTEPDTSSCQYTFTATEGDNIVIHDISIPYSKVLTNTNNFISSCKSVNESPLIISDSQLKTHQIILNFDAVYPINNLKLTNYNASDALPLDNVSISISINGSKYTSIYTDYTLNSGENIISFDNQLAKSVKIIFPDETSPVGIQDLRFELGEGLIVKEETEMSNALLRYDGWTGADGIFSFDLDNGGDTIGVNHSTTGFVFSDTFIGTVNSFNNLRGPRTMINNSFGYLDDEVPFSADAFTFAYGGTEANPVSVLLPDNYIGSRARNLLDNDGLTISNDKDGLLTSSGDGTMWLTDNLNSSVIIDLYNTYDVKNMYIWNYNADSNLGVKAFNLYTSNDNTNYELYGSYNIDKASGNDNEPYTLAIDLNSVNTRYIKLQVTDTYSDSKVGLGKIMLFSADGNPLFGEATSTSTVPAYTKNELSSRLWLQDGVIIDKKIYIFPLLVKDYLTYFKVFSVGAIEMNIVGDQFDYQNAIYHNSPLMSQTNDGGIIYYGAGVMDNRNVDGYIYIYGYKDLNGRNLVVARTTAENILNFNEWNYYDGSGWSNNINDSAALKGKVSPELSVTHIDSGMFAGKYMLVCMLNTTSGNIAYSISDTPYGTFGEYHTIYTTTESTYLRGAFTYNAKMHPNLSTDGKFIISYNVNTSNASALADARIYHPRFISITEVKQK